MCVFTTPCRPRGLLCDNKTIFSIFFLPRNPEINSMKYKLFFLLSQKCGLLCRRLTFFEKPIILKVFPLFFHYILRLTKVFLKIKFSLYVGLLSPDLLPIIGPHGLLLDWILSAPPSPSTPCLPDLLHYCFKGCICSLFLVRSVAAAGTNKEQLHCRQFVVNSPPLGH